MAIGLPGSRQGQIISQIQKEFLAYQSAGTLGERAHPLYAMPQTELRCESAMMISVWSDIVHDALVPWGNSMDFYHRVKIATS